MSRNAKILIDLAVLAAVYGIWLLPKWRPLGRRTLAVYTLMYGCLASIALFTLSVGIEVVQPLLHAFRSSDITDVITNTTGGVLGYALWAIVHACRKKRED